VDAIEAGIGEIPRVPVDDNTGAIIPQYFRLWEYINQKLPASERQTARRTASGVRHAAQPSPTVQSFSPSEAIAKLSWTDLATPEDEKCGTVAPGCSLKEQARAPTLNCRRGRLLYIWRGIFKVKEQGGGGWGCRGRVQRPGSESRRSVQAVSGRHPVGAAGAGLRAL